MSLGIGGAGRQNPFLAQQAGALQQPNRLLAEGGAQVPAIGPQAVNGCCGQAAQDITRKLSAIG